MKENRFIFYEWLGISFHGIYMESTSKEAPFTSEWLSCLSKKTRNQTASGMLCLENSPFFHAKSHCRDTEAAADLSHS